jgi:predicted unusual protein kinase regulating ubiquinone biosynthesis (AarF/ABC1/UbiB family)
MPADIPDHTASVARARSVPSGRLTRAARFGALAAGVAGNMAVAGVGQMGRGQRPDMRSLLLSPRNITRITNELAQMRGAAMKLGQLVSMDTGDMLPSGFDLAPYLAQACAQLHEETDYAREAAAMARFAALLSGEEAVFSVPQVVAEWSTPRILAMTFQPGIPIEDVAQEDQATRDHVATTLIDLLLRELFLFGYMQTDPNFANYRWDPGARRIVLLDFGAARDIPAGVRSDYRALMAAGLGGDTAGLAAHARAMGIYDDSTDPAHRDRIITMMQAVFAALSAAGPFDFADDALSRRLQAEGMALATDGFVPPPLPMDLLYVQRKFAGVFLLAARLGARVDLAPLLARYL